MYKYLFGPVPSRRLGVSLGIDLVPKKVCSLDCIYCEVGKTTKLTVKRDEYIPIEKLKEELENYFSNNPDPDYFTFSGSGEPTLNIRIGEVIDFIKQQKNSIPIAVLTNGTLFYDKDVRNDIKKADIVLPSLDAATQNLFKKINRPQKNLTVDKHIEGLVNFRNEFGGKIWLEVFILRGYNDKKEELIEIKKVIEKIKPDLVQLNTLDRPCNIENLRAASGTELEGVADFLEMGNVEIISSSESRKNIQAYRKDVEEAIVETIARRPCTIDDLTKILGLHINEINKYLEVLESGEKIKSIVSERGVFYVHKK